MPIRDVEFCRMKVEDLRPADYNPRTISDKAFAGLSESMDKFGLLAHIVWNKRTGNVVGGHQRLRHLIESGAKETDVIVVDLPDKDEIALNITLNNPHVRGDFTAEIMEQLKECNSTMEDYAELGMDDLYSQLKKMGYEKKAQKDKSKEEDSSSNDNATAVSETAVAEEIENNEEGNGSFACITCPECGSKWRMEDNKVVFNGVIQTEEGMEKVLEENGKI